MAIRGKPSNDRPRPPRSPMNWMWIVLVFLLAGQALMYFGSSKAETVSWSEFKNGMLAQGDVERIVVVNDKDAEVYLKENEIGQGDYAEIDRKNPGPHYTFRIPSVDKFEEPITHAAEILSAVVDKVICW